MSINVDDDKGEDDGVMSRLPTVSVVTPSYNSARFIEATIHSVMQQSYRPVEHIVIDGGSTDGTIEILERYSHLNWVSEPDTGQADALNKGFKLATSEIIAWLNADDLYVQDTLDFVARFFATNPQVDLIYGEVDWINEQGQLVCHVPTKPFVLSEALHENPITQPAAFFQRSVLERVGYLKSSYHYLMDYEFWLRVALACKVCYIPRTLARFRIAEGTKTQEHEDRFALEYLQVLEDIFSSLHFPSELASLRGKLLARGHWHAGLALYRSDQPEAAWSHCQKALNEYAILSQDEAYAIRDVVFVTSVHLKSPANANWINELVSDLTEHPGCQRRLISKIKAHFYATRAFYYFDHGQRRLAHKDLWRCIFHNPAWLRNRGVLKRLALSLA